MRSTAGSSSGRKTRIQLVRPPSSGPLDGSCRNRSPATSWKVMSPPASRTMPAKRSCTASCRSPSWSRCTCTRRACASTHDSTATAHHGRYCTSVASAMCMRSSLMSRALQPERLAEAAEARRELVQRMGSVVGLREEERREHHARPFTTAEEVRSEHVLLGVEAMPPLVGVVPRKEDVVDPDEHTRWDRRKDLEQHHYRVGRAVCLVRAVEQHHVAGLEGCEAREVD